ncbi:hypothetical protein HN51_000064 [Arachis hypogaea]|uniref:Uncharacterized protein n=3 Tax=Arachis TaxID=3817 RepID=A0A445EX92_ARAHY|nr:uncharacterized protein LOC107476156 [Arachis duranensis]XP_025686978.1 uncharacterized protein LOC112789344 [Arachis hypogaea]XP_057728413.1 uncharacterized protein LOC130944215 [Arachis stenosperma]QHO47849.1 uncharacterized protein DS421_1g00740 [Arachis hypogaea]RYR80059.1 hypothetical protein Ahy_A01g004834 [Arachis hypogaea]
MLRSMTTRRGPGRYEKLGKESSTTALLHEEFKRSTSLPAHRTLSSSSRKMGSSALFGNINLQRNPTKRGNGNNNNNGSKKSHPLLSFLDLRKKSKTTARPEFARYVEYLKEGGMWDFKTNKPVIHYT